jgi:hypothetical protein
MPLIGGDIELVQRAGCGEVKANRDCHTLQGTAMPQIGGDIELVHRERDIVKLWQIGTLVHLKNCVAAYRRGRRAGAQRAEYGEVAVGRDCHIYQGL